MQPPTRTCTSQLLRGKTSATACAWIPVLFVPETNRVVQWMCGNCGVRWCGVDEEIQVG